MSALLIAVVVDLSLFFAIAWWLASSRHLSRPSNVMCELQNAVSIRQNSLARLFTGFSTTISKANVCRIQVTDQCLTLYTRSNFAIDIWVAPSQLDANAARARSLFPSADYLEVV
ncbi:hypothetical protein DXV75_06430 [Alteromonas aestuariivivens]|uniref:Uncharacterized protein n=1 Tax=Alteromonas aestuariivivens TaxID=1938339 RepID=A0A3D8MA09_9ALTE|nr:hypothetical protein [Alteromonas aestuariivivens]RDV26625.1 hypothetical protein DXV75_06430 [Alteromonas aestuariivivens]